MVDRFGLLDLRDQRGAAAGFVNQLLRVLTIARASHEGECDVVGVLRDGPFEIDDVFVSQRCDRKGDARQIDSFALAQQTAIDDFGNHVRVGCTFNDERERAVVEQHASTWLDYPRKIGVVGRNLMFVPGNCSCSDREK